MSSLLQLVNEVLRRTGQTETDTLVNAATPVAQAVDFLNETYIDMLHRLKAQQLMRQGSLTTSNGTAQYNLEADAEINSLISDSVTETTSKINLCEVDYTFSLSHDPAATGRPTHFYRSGSQIHLCPIPDAAYTIQYQYLLKPAALSDDADTTELPVEWEKVLITGAQARLEKFLGEEAEETYFLYRDGLDQLKSRSPLKPHYRMKGFYRGNA